MFQIYFSHYIKETLCHIFVTEEREREIRVPLVPLLILGFCTQTSLKSWLLESCIVAIIAVCVNLLWDPWEVFLHTSLGFSRRRSFIQLDDQFSCCHWSLKKHKWGCLYLVVNPRKKESMDSKRARGRVSKFYWRVAIKSQVWGLISLIIWTSILSR